MGLNVLFFNKEGPSLTGNGAKVDNERHSPEDLFLGKKADDGFSGVRKLGKMRKSCFWVQVCLVQ